MTYPDFMKSFSEEMMKAAKMTGGDIANLSNSIKEVHKVGVKVPFSWEYLVDNPRNGHYEPTGIKWVQWIGWAYGLVLYKAWRLLERRLDKIRHFEGVSGYEWDDAEYREFSQKRKWVEDE
jgi:hypothetical protein